MLYFTSIESKFSTSMAYWGTTNLEMGITGATLSISQSLNKKKLMGILGVKLYVEMVSLVVNQVGNPTNKLNY